MKNKFHHILLLAIGMVCTVSVTRAQDKGSTEPPTEKKLLQPEYSLSPVTFEIKAYGCQLIETPATALICNEYCAVQPMEEPVKLLSIKPYFVWERLNSHYIPDKIGDVCKAYIKINSPPNRLG